MANGDGFDPPQSSMLATHVKPGAAVPHLNQQNFAQLLEESLGQDENGRPNLGDDPVLNHKLVMVIIQVGIDPLLVSEKDNPFRTNPQRGKNGLQLQQCLAVLYLAVTRTHNLLYHVVPTEDATVDPVPLFHHLLPKLLSVIGRYQNVDITKNIFSIIEAALQEDRKAMPGSPSALTTFLEICFAGFLTLAASQQSSNLNAKVLLSDELFTQSGHNDGASCKGLCEKFCITNATQLLFISCQLATFLSSRATLKPAILRLRKQTSKLQAIVESVQQSAPDNAVEIESLRADLRGLSVNQMSCSQSFGTVDEVDGWADENHARKRPRLSTNSELTEAHPNSIGQISSEVMMQLFGQISDDLTGLSAMIAEKFRSLAEDEQVQTLDRLGRAACQFANPMGVVAGTCPCCEEESLDLEAAVDSEVQLSELLKSILVLKQFVFRRPKLRLSALKALKKIVIHSASADTLKLKGGNAGEWCLQALRSPARSTRLCGIPTLLAFVRNEARRDGSVIHDNRVTTLEFLQALRKDSQPSSQEVAVLTLSQMARIASDEEINIILLRLVDYLGYQNAYISALAFSELQQLAQYCNVAVANLFRPYWRTLSVVIVQNFSKRPVIAQLVSELVGTQVDGLLQIIKEHALPHVILSREKNIITRLCASCEPPITAYDLCTEIKNFARILALLMAQSFPEPEQSIMSLLVDVSDDFRDQDLAGWVQSYPVEIACELLKLIADAGPGKAAKSYQGFQLLASLQSRRSGSSAASRGRTETASSFLELHALAIVTHFTVKLNDGAIREPNIEKRRYITALGEAVKMGNGNVTIALPHICACLRAAMEETALCNTAFEVWCEMMTSIDSDDMCDLINQTFAIIVKIWPELQSRMQEKAYNLVANLFKEHADLIREFHSTMPSLKSIPLMSKFGMELDKLKKQSDERNQLAAYVSRLKDENMIVVEQVLNELSPVLREKQEFLQKSIFREQPDTLIADLTRALLDVGVKFRNNRNVLLHCGQCLGAVGCLDAVKIESIREKKRFVVVSNFIKGDETVGFLMFFMEHILVKEYLSTSNLREKGFLAWSLQRLLQLCDLPADITSRARVGGLSGRDREWFELSDTSRLVLTPFLTSKFTSLRKRPRDKISYPYFKPGMTYKTWLREVTYDLLKRASGENVDMIFDTCSQLVAQGQSTSIASFLLPYVALNLLLTGTEHDKQDLFSELSWVLRQALADADIEMQDHIRQCSQSVFDVLDYMSSWLQDTRKQSSTAKARADRGIRDPILERVLAQAQTVEAAIALIPPQIITQKAMECRSFARALFHQEQYVSSKAEPSDDDYHRLQDIYAQIDEPDGMEGFSAQVKIIDVRSEVMEHQKAGRWNAVQSWYEMQLTDQPKNTEAQLNLLKCLKESGQHDVLIHHFDGIVDGAERSFSNLVPLAVEAAWATHRWDKLSSYLTDAPKGDFAVGIGNIMLALERNKPDTTREILDQMFASGTFEMTPNSTVSFQSSHETRLKLHILEDVHIMIMAASTGDDPPSPKLRKRLDILSSNVADKQYVLGIHRAFMRLLPKHYDDRDIASSWMASARIARKSRATQHAHNAVLRASALGDTSVAIEQSKLLWQEGDHRKAIQTLKGAIDSGTFGSHVQHMDVDTATVDNAAQEDRNEMAAKAFVLLGKWLDQAGQTQSEVIIKTFRKSTEQNRRWEKGWYNLGRHYNKILESEKLKPPGKESQPYLTGEAAKLVIDNFLRALVSGHKYMFQTLPKVLTLWLDLVGSEIEHDPRRGNSQFHQHNKTQRKKVVDETNATMKKYVDGIQAYALYTILPQLVARICHSDQTVSSILQMLIVKVVRAFPQQALWTVLATVKSKSKDRATRGLGLLRKCAENAKKDLKVFTASEMRDFITASQKFSDEILRIADFQLEGRVVKVSLARDFGFNHKIAPSKLVVPSEACLTPNIPPNNELQLSKSFRAFSKEPVTISAFLDEARVLPSLQKPRKLSLRGSDGVVYNMLAKPHDDLRKDQRLMEFNTMINRFLKHDIDAAKRRLYIKTYAVMPLNEECGLIEWVDGLTTMRDILLKLYDQRGIKPDYNGVRESLDKICARSEDKAKDFIEQVQVRFPPVLRQWFIENFPDPTAWFNARLRYTRTSAVMSMVGHVLGLGDRHGENILFEEGTGGILHVDFNCLFDKGLTFEKPECVPFRLTHNMRVAMGAYKCEGPFRRCCEITTTILRNDEDALMTILETFLHDPTTDFQTTGKKRKPSAGGYAANIEVPDTPERMLEGVKGKVRGMLPGESVPLSVAGYVEYMIRQAADEANLARMYIGWCAFF